jgi:hypothetical protein
MVKVAALTINGSGADVIFCSDPSDARRNVSVAPSVCVAEWCQPSVVHEGWCGGESVCMRVCVFVCVDVYSFVWMRAAERTCARMIHEI